MTLIHQPYGNLRMLSFPGVRAVVAATDGARPRRVSGDRAIGWRAVATPIWWVDSERFDGALAVGTLAALGTVGLWLHGALPS